jgi:hypothetical protein
MITNGNWKLPPPVEAKVDDTLAVEAVLKADTRLWDLLKEQEVGIGESD